MRHSFIVSPKFVTALSLSESASSTSLRPSFASTSTSDDNHTNTTSASPKDGQGLSRFTTLDDTIEMLNDLIKDALAFFRGLFRFRVAQQSLACMLAL